MHLLPFYIPFDGADGGFDPVDHTQVDPRLGDWEDVRDLASRYEVVADVIANHMSAQSPQFLDTVARGDASEHAGTFLTLGSVFPEGASESDLLAIYRPRPGIPFTVMPWGEERRLVWTTFTEHQVDLDVADAETDAYIDEVWRALAGAGVSMVRLDAVGYVVKTAGTTCFMTPATMEFIRRITARAHAASAWRSSPRRTPTTRCRWAGRGCRLGLRLRPAAARAVQPVHRRRRPVAPLAGDPAPQLRDRAGHP